jgi:hypothetical protein
MNTRAPVFEKYIFGTPKKLKLNTYKYWNFKSKVEILEKNMLYFKLYKNTNF